MNYGLPGNLTKSYQILAPKSTHFRPASCKEVNCPNYLFGWKTVIDASTDLGQKQAHYIEKMSGRGFKKETDAAGIITYTFEAGQQCFKPHQVRKENSQELYLVKDGTARRADNVRRHANAADWVDDFQNHQDKLKETLDRG